MAKLFLDANDLNIHVSNPMTVFGSTGAESVLVDANTTGVVVDQNVERVDLPGAASAFTYQQAGNQLLVYSGATLVATIPLQGDADGTQVVFTNGSVQATLVGGVMTLGGATVTTTAAAVTPTTIDSGTTSGSNTGAGVTPTFSVAAGAASVTEGNTATFTVTLSAAQGTATTVAFALEGTGGAVLGTDTGAATPGNTGTLTFAPGEVTKTITVPVTFDSTTETGEGLKVTLSSPGTGTSLGTSTASTSIVDPAAPTFTITSNAVAGASTEEGNTIIYTITPSGITDKAYTFTLSTVGDTLGGVATAASASDFSPASQTITFAAGTSAAQTVTQTVVNDGITEGLEGYKTNLINSSLVSVGNVTGMINDPITSPTGTTYTLTTSTDNVPGTNGNDIIIGDWGATTVNAADQINGGSGTDTFKVYGNIGTLPASISGIEVLDLVNPDKLGFDLTTVGGPVGLTKLTIEQAPSTAAAATTITTTNFSGLTLDLATAGGVGVGHTGVTWAANAADTAQTLELSGYNGKAGATAQAFTITGAATKTLNINTDTAANAITTLTGPATTETLNINAATNLTIGTAGAATGYVGASVKNVNVTGAGYVTIQGTSTDMAATLTVDGSANTGGLSFQNAEASTLTFKGGSGNDVVQFAATTLTTADTLTGGTGVDTLIVNDTALATFYSAINAASGFEVLGFNTTAATVDMANLTSINNIYVGPAAGANSITVTNALSTSTFTLDERVGNTGTVSIQNKVGETGTSITLDHGTATTAQTLAALTLNGATNVSLVSTGTGTGGSNIITTLTNMDNSVFTVTGSKDLTITNALAGTGTGSKVDGTSFTGKLNVTGSGLADIFIGGSGNDTFNGGAGKDTITGGAGDDTITVSTATQADVLTGGAGVDSFKFSGTATTMFTTSDATTEIVRISDFVAGTDKIGLVDTVGAFTSITLTTQTMATAADLAAIWAGITAVTLSVDGGALYGSVITVSGGAAAGTYLYVNDTAGAGVSSAADMLVNITGISGTLAATDFVFA